MFIEGYRGTARVWTTDRRLSSTTTECTISVRDIFLAFLLLLLPSGVV
jgi:hypothetical protein